MVTVLDQIASKINHQKSNIMKLKKLNSIWHKIGRKTIAIKSASLCKQYCKAESIRYRGPWLIGTIENGGIYPQENKPTNAIDLTDCKNDIVYRMNDMGYNINLPTAILSPRMRWRKGNHELCMYCWQSVQSLFFLPREKYEYQSWKFWKRQYISKAKALSGPKLP